MESPASMEDPKGLLVRPDFVEINSESGSPQIVPNDSVIRDCAKQQFGDILNPRGLWQNIGFGDNKRRKMWQDAVEARVKEYQESVIKLSPNIQRGLEELDSKQKEFVDGLPEASDGKKLLEKYGIFCLRLLEPREPSQKLEFGLLRAEGGLPDYEMLAISATGEVWQIKFQNIFPRTSKYGVGGNGTVSRSPNPLTEADISTLNQFLGNNSTGHNDFLHEDNQYRWEGKKLDLGLRAETIQENVKKSQELAVKEAIKLLETEKQKANVLA